MKLMHIVGARPNFMKAAPVCNALSFEQEIEQKIVHTGQHYDENMSRVFFKQLDLPEPDIDLEVGSGSHAKQTADIMVRLDTLLSQETTDMVVVYGDINSTLAAAIVCSKLGICVAHVEAGLRSFDMSMPEEINRILTDRIANLLFTPSVDGNENLIAEGVSEEKIYFVGNVMIDTLVRLLPQAETRWKGLSAELSIGSAEYGVITLHRPSNVDHPEDLRRLLNGLEKLAYSANIPLVFPVHPRTRRKLDGCYLDSDRIILTEPMGYIEFLSIQKNARFVITDSGGIQEETTFLGVPCYTLRSNTERPVTMSHGTNTLVGDDVDALLSEVAHNKVDSFGSKKVPLLWDGNAANRIAKIVVDYF